MESEISALAGVLYSHESILSETILLQIEAAVDCRELMQIHVDLSSGLSLRDPGVRITTQPFESKAKAEHVKLKLSRESFKSPHETKFCSEWKSAKHMNDIPIAIPTPGRGESVGADGWSIRASPTASNPIRKTIESMPGLLHSSSQKHPIALALGDPTRLSKSNAILSAPRSAIEALADAITSSSSNGYCQSSGSDRCRRAVADHLSEDLPYGLRADDIFMTAGCSQALQFCIAALAPGFSSSPANILLPRPGFPLYRSLCTFYGVESREYDLIPEQGWKIDLQSLKRRADRNTVAIILCNPGNPCGSVYSYQHLKEIAGVANELRVPIISDEIYAKIVFGDEVSFVPMGTFAWEAPVLSVGGISKRWFVPGWRAGWISVCDPRGIFKQAKIHEAFKNLSDMQLSLASPIQTAIPAILEDTPADFFSKNLEALAAGAELSYRRAQQIPGLSCPSKPLGSMYIMVRLEITRFSDLDDDVEFARALAKEEAVTVLPGSAFGYPGWVRLLFAAPVSILDDAWNRIQAFCKRHT